MRKDNYHILIKNLSNGKEEGFMLASGDTPYMIQGVDNVAQRVQDGEILYSDFTNSRVFAQSEWSEGVSRYWEPEKNGFYIFPSKKYKDKKNIVVNEGEFTLGGNVTTGYTLPSGIGTGPMCRGEAAGIVYAGAGMILYKSTDYGVNWSVFKDFTSVSQLSDVNEITDIVVTDPEPFTKAHGGDIGTIGIAGIQEIFVCFYNRTTKVSGLARYDISFNVRAATGTTLKTGWSGSATVAYGSIRSTININTSGLSTATIAATKVNNSGGLTIPGTWQSYGLFPGQRIKLFRINTGVTYNLTVTWVGGAFGGTNEIGVSGIPSYDAGTSANNNYNLSEIGMNAADVCFPLNSGGIEVVVNAGLGLGQNFIHGGVTYTVRGLGNGMNMFGNIPSYFPGAGSGSQDFVMVRRIDGVNAYSLYGNGNINPSMEKWVYKNGTYLNNITKFIRVTQEREHLWGVNHIDPINKLYDVGYGELTSNCTYSLMYSNSLDGVLHGLQNHTVTFNDGDCPISGTGAGVYSNIMYVGTQYGSTGAGTQGSLLRFTLDDTNMTAPTYKIPGIVGERGISCMTYFGSILYMGTKEKGYVYEYNNGTGFLTQLAKLPIDPTTEIGYIDSMTNYAGKVVCSYQAGSGVYQLDPNSRNTAFGASPLIEIDSLCQVDTITNQRIYNICNTGGGLLFSDGLTIYSYDFAGIASQGYMESSIYGGYISNVDKLWIYAYVRVGKWLIEDGQRVAMEVSMDEGITWNYLPIVPGKPFSPTNAWNDIYSMSKTDTSDDQQLTFFFPYNTKSGTILYRCWLKKGTTVKPVVNHIGVHYNLNYKQELLFNYQLDLNKSMELLGGRTVEKDLQNPKLAFLKSIWQNQDMVQLTDVTGKTYTCMPFSDERTPGQGLVISTSNANTAKLDIDNLTYRVAFSLKTIANYEKIL